MTRQRSQFRHLKCTLKDITQTEAGYIIKRPTLRGLVLNGCGVKGIAYAGMFQALYEHDYLKDITHLSDASAGAMSTSFFSFCMSTEDFDITSNKLNIKNLINPSLTGGRADGTSFRNTLELSYLYQTQQVLQNVDRNLLSESELCD